MAKALFHELSKENTKANNCVAQFQSGKLNKAKEQYLSMIESSLNSIKEAQLKRKIIVFLILIQFTKYLALAASLA